MRNSIFKFAQKLEIMNRKTFLAQQGKITLILTALCALFILFNSWGLEDDVYV